MFKWFALLLLPVVLFADGESVYKAKCASCHAGYISMGELKENFVEYNNTKLNLKGPTLNQLSFRLKQNIGDPKGDKEFHLMEVVEFVKDYVIHPDIQKSVCMDEVKEAFGVMPSMKGQISDEELEAVAEYIYHYDVNMVKKHAPKYSDYTAAVEAAKKEHKIIMIKATSAHCHYCKKMDREVFSEESIIDAIDADFVPVEIDVYESALPKGLSYKVTPTFFFLDENEKLLKMVPGSWDKEDFLEILKETKGVKND